MPFVDDLSAWIIRQRWFAGKGHVARLRVLDAQPAPGGVTRYFVMDDAGARPTLYQVPVAIDRDGAPGEELVALDDAGRHVVDATTRLGFVAGLLTEMGVDATGVTGSRVLPGEQSNTSIVVDEAGAPTIIVKVFRTLHHGENPDVTVQRALGASGSPFVPQFLGSVESEWPDTGRRLGVARGTTAFAQEFLPGARDGWSIAVEAARDGRPFTTAARDLGVAVAGVHGALAAALPARPGRSTDAAAAVAAWHRRLALAVAEVPAIAERRAAIQAVYQAAFAPRWPRMQRIHGDLHLGQVLAVPGGGWRLVDFEGEPLRPMRERAVLDLPLRDVAGMLRSFAYAGAVGAGPDPTGWTRACRDAFLTAYVEHTPASALDAGLLRALELDKAVYEATYEERNRPDWLAIPIAGIDAALVPSASA